MFAAAQPVPQYNVSAATLPEADEAASSYRSMERSNDTGSGCHGDDQSQAAVTSETSTECIRAEGSSSPSSTSSLTSPQTLRQSSVQTFPSSAQQLPKNAVELIAWAITECVSTTPTLVQIASRIHKQVATYRDQDLGVVMRMVQHHLDSNNPEYFLPVLMAPPGVSGRPPAMNKWALNHQTVHVRKDGSLSRRRPHRPTPSSSYVSKHVTSSSPYTQACPSPKYLLQCLQSEGAQQGSGTSQLQVYSGTPPPAASYLPAAIGQCSSSSSSTVGGTVYSFSTANGGRTYSSAADPISSTAGMQQLSRAGAYGSTQGPAAYRGGPSYPPAAGPYGGPGYSTAAGPYGALASPTYSTLGAAYGLTSASGYASGFGLGLHPALYGGVGNGAGYEVSGTYSLTQGTTFDLSYATGPAAGATAVTGGGIAYQCSL